MKDFEILLGGSPGHSFHPGSTIVGTVLCENSIPKKFKKIVIYLEGRADVAWAGTRSLSDIDGCIRRYGTSRVYISETAVLWDKVIHGNGGMFPAGIQNLSFAFQLPVYSHLPPSFTGAFGSIKYFLEARIVRDAALKSDSAVICPVKIANVISVAGNPELARPLSVEAQKTVCCFCCMSAPIVMTVRVPKRGYCIGNDSIPVEVHVENGSFRTISKIRLYIEKRVIYTSGSNYRFQTDQLNRVASGPIRARTSTVFRPDPLVLARDTPPTLLNCELISVNYLLRVSAIMSVNIDLDMEIPLVLGNVRGIDPPVRLESVSQFVPSPTVPLPVQGYDNPLFNQRQSYAEPVQSYNPQFVQGSSTLTRQSSGHPEPYNPQFVQDSSTLTRQSSHPAEPYNPKFVQDSGQSIPSAPDSNLVD